MSEDQSTTPPQPEISLPVVLGSTVIKGFGRGGKMLGVPTANMCIEEMGTLVNEIPTGIWYGWASLRGQVYKAVTSIGWNPYFHNEKKSVEPHLLHEFADDFYDEPLRLMLCGFIRPEKNFPSLEALIAAIKNDIEVAEKALDEDPWRAFGSRDLAWTSQG